MTIERVNYDDLTEDEKNSLKQAEKELKNGETLSHNSIN